MDNINSEYTNDASFKQMVKRAVEATTSEDALRFSEAALTLANAFAAYKTKNTDK